MLTNNFGLQYVRTAQRDDQNPRLYQRGGGWYKRGGDEERDKYCVGPSSIFGVFLKWPRSTVDLRLSKTLVYWLCNEGLIYMCFAGELFTCSAALVCCAVFPRACNRH